MDREKCRITMRLQIEYVPRDILFSILSRLPLKSVLRFCCVSKYWFDVIIDPDFRRLHFLQLATDPTILILLRRKSMENIISLNPLNRKEQESIFRNPRFRVTAEVYTLGATGSWKAVQGFNRPPYGPPVFANGAVHWVVHPFLSHKYERIISFDMGKDEFDVTPHPQFSSNISICELGGCLSVVPDIEYDLVKVWVLKDYTENCWEKNYIFHIIGPIPV